MFKPKLLHMKKLSQKEMTGILGGALASCTAEGGACGSCTDPVGDCCRGLICHNAGIIAGTCIRAESLEQ